MVGGVPQMNPGAPTNIRLTVTGVESTEPVVGVEARFDLGSGYRVNDAGVDPTEILDPTEGGFGDHWPMAWIGTAEAQPSADRYFMSVFSVAHDTDGGADGNFGFANVSITALEPGDIVLKAGSAIAALVDGFPTNVDLSGLLVATVFGSVSRGPENPDVPSIEPPTPDLEPPDPGREHMIRHPSVDELLTEWIAGAREETDSSSTSDPEGFVRNNTQGFPLAVMSEVRSRSGSLGRSRHDLSESPGYATPEPDPFTLVALAVGVLLVGRAVRKRRAAGD
jgi:hypothetical protein